MKCLLLLIGCAYATALPFTNVSNGHGGLSVINGNNAQRYQFPYMVSVQLEGVHKCGASIISKSWLVSAAHCYNSNRTYTAVAGLLIQGEKSNEVQTTTIEKIISAGFDASAGFSNDIALLKLKHPLRFNTKAVLPVRLPKKDKIPTGQAVASGWGQVANNPKPIYPHVLQYIDLKVLTNKQCINFLENNFWPGTDIKKRVITDSFCVFPEETSQSMCYRDSGGPLVQDYTLVGITQAVFDETCNQVASIPYPNTYTRVSHFINFINEHVKF